MKTKTGGEGGAAAMDAMAWDDLKRMRHELKKWERSFTTTNLRAPTTRDILTSPSIRSIYRQYAALKAELNPTQNKLKTIHTAGVHLESNGMALSNSSPVHSSSHSDDSQSSHISATPPKHNRLLQSFESHPKSVSPKLKKNASVDTQKIGMNKNNAATLSPCIRVLSLADHNLTSCTPKKNTCSLKKAMPTDIPENIDKQLQLSTLGFRIMKERCGEQLRLMESEAENFPAGFIANCGSSLRISSAAFTSRRVVAKNHCLQLNDSPGMATQDDSVKEVECCALGHQHSITNSETCNSLHCGFHHEQRPKNCKRVVVSEIQRGLVDSGRQLGEQISMIVDDAIGKLVRQPNGAEHACFNETPCSSANLTNMLPSKRAGRTTGLTKDLECTQNCTSLRFDASNEKNISFNAKSLKELTVLSLKHELSARGLSMSGNKAVLIHRLLCNLEAGKDNDDKMKRCGLRHSVTQKKKRQDALDDTVTCLGQRKPNCISSSEKNIASAHTENDGNVVALTTIKQSRKRSYLHLGDTGPEDVVKQVKKHRALCGIKQETHVQSLEKPSRRIRRALQIDPTKQKTDITRENFVKLKINPKCGRTYRFKYKKRSGNSRWRVYGLKSRKWRKNSSTAAESVDVSSFESLYNNNANLCKHECENVLPHHSREKLNSSIDANEHACDVYIANSIEEAKAGALLFPTEQNLLKVLKLVFGHALFRPGQLETIQKIMAQQSAMLVLPTGFGKSLCYQLPAFLLPGLTLVISPIVALMVDQFNSLPSRLPGAFLSCNQTFEEAASVLDKLRSSMLKVLFVSPERLLSENFVALLNDLHPISLAVVDEAHCLSEWSCNFRPSYFRLGFILRNRLKVHSILAMTATATTKTIDSILHSLSIPATGMVKVAQLQQNLQYSVSWTENRLSDLLSLLQSPPYSEASSIIVYCKFQSEADDVSRFLCNNKIQAKSYHAGMTLLDRTKIQELFCCNKLRIVVATVAFGLGLNKHDVRAVIHFGLPNSLEQYVQETGRAGRNGEAAYCHLFLDNNTFLKLRSLCYSDNVDDYTLRSFLDKVFEGCLHEHQSNHVRSIFIDSTERELDLKKEVMSTILCYLEVGDMQYLEMLPEVKATCLLRIHKNALELLAKKNDLLTTILKRSQNKHEQYTFNLPSFANNLGLSLSQMQQQLQELKVQGDISYDLVNHSFCFHVLKVPEDRASLVSNLSLWFAKMENLKVKKLDYMYMLASDEATDLRGANATSTSFKCLLQPKINNYFNMDETDLLCSGVPSIVKYTSPFLKADIKVFLQGNPQARFTGRAVARIFHGLWSPAFPSSVWSSNHFWGRYTDIDFNAIKEAATLEIRNLRGVRPWV